MARKQSKEQVRNLFQYKDLTDEEFDEMWEGRNRTINYQEDFEKRVTDKIAEFSEDYDLDDLKINDRETLKALVRAILSLEDYENTIYQLRADQDISQSNINIVDRVSRVMSDLRKDISRLQEDLNISRKNRKSDKESSVVSYIANLKTQARKFHESRSQYIFCPKCNMLVATVWSLYPDQNNKLTFTCNRELDDGSRCGEKITVNTKDLIDSGTNKEDLMPEGLM